MDTQTQNPFEQLQKALNDFNTEGAKKKSDLLQECSKEKPASAKVLSGYHDNLLFLSAYADNREVFDMANSEMKRITELVRNSVSLQNKLINSGIAFTSTQSTYSLSLLKWLIDIYPGTVSFHSFDESGVHPKEVLKHALPEAEFELLSDDKLNAEKWLKKASGRKDAARQMEWLIRTMDATHTTDLIKDQLFDSMKVYAEINPVTEKFSPSFGNVPVKPHYFHNEPLLKKFNEHELINKPLPAERLLTKEQKKEIIAASRIALCLLQRETDPVTYSEELNIKYYELERGLSIALFSMDAERRFPLESYIGFMMFKNGYPMSYGGAWLFGKRSLIGINIFEAYRGGESAVVFAQLLRCYSKAFGARYFEVEPYQFGKNNPEGIKSGAFWFYYRFGFRPLDNKLHELALSEHSKITGEKGYRSSQETLKRFTHSNLFVHLDNERQKPLNPSDLSRFASHKIVKAFNGDRGKAYKQAVKQLKAEKIITGKENALGLKKLSILIAFCIDGSQLKAADKKLLQQMINAKAEEEFRYMEILGRFSFPDHLTEEAKSFLL